MKNFWWICVCSRSFRFVWLTRHRPLMFDIFLMWKKAVGVWLSFPASSNFAFIPLRMVKLFSKLITLKSGAFDKNDWWSPRGFFSDHQGIWIFRMALSRKRTHNTESEWAVIKTYIPWQFWAPAIKCALFIGRGVMRVTHCLSGENWELLNWS
jgi:hypothetical protein